MRNISSSSIPDLISKILSQRGIGRPEEQNDFLFPKLSSLPPPENMLNLQEGAAVVKDYILNQKNIIIWGDYDVDGTTGTALLVLFFKSIGVDVLWHIPNRLEEGYGLNINWFASNKAKTGDDFLLITVDCGISDKQTIASIQKLGGKVIVTDHHAIPHDFKPNCTVINPSQSNCAFNKHCLAGVGVAFYLAAAIRKKLAEVSSFKDIYKTINLKQLLPLVALGTIADIVDLTPANRILVRAGLEALEDCKIPGVNALLELCDVDGHKLTSEDIGYQVGPKINAAGRLGKSRVVVQLFTEENHGKAKRLAQKLLKLNQERKDVTSESLETALALVSTYQVEKDKCIVVAGDIHKGVAGIVASRLVDTFKVPAVVISLPEEGIQSLCAGSARSTSNINIVKLLESCSFCLEKYGGHEMAAGILVDKRNIDLFIAEFKKQLLAELSVNPTKSCTRKYDTECTIEELQKEDVLLFYNLLEPFGPLNPQPVFKIKQLTVVDSRRVGKLDEHLTLSIRGKDGNIKGIGFQMGDLQNDIQESPMREAIVTPTKNRFRGTTSWQLRIIEI